MWIILHYNQDTLNVLEFSNLTKYDHTIVLNFFGKVQIIIYQLGFELMTYRLVVNTQTHCATL